jgi:hypothetical protein
MLNLKLTTTISRTMLRTAPPTILPGLGCSEPQDEQCQRQNHEFPNGRRRSQPSAAGRVFGYTQASGQALVQLKDGCKKIHVLP